MIVFCFQLFLKLFKILIFGFDSFILFFDLENVCLFSFFEAFHRIVSTVLSGEHVFAVLFFYLFQVLFVLPLHQRNPLIQPFYRYLLEFALLPLLFDRCSEVVFENLFDFVLSWAWLVLWLVDW